MHPPLFRVGREHLKLLTVPHFQQLLVVGISQLADARTALGFRFLKRNQT